MRITRSLCLAAAVSLAAFTSADARTLSGAYLAAQQAEARADHAQAAYYYTRALSFDPSDPRILQRAMQSHVSAGDLTTSAAIADRLLSLNGENQFATLVALVSDVRAGEPARALARLDMGEEAMTPLLADLLRGWVEVELGATDQARATFEAIRGSQTFDMFGRFHEGLSLAMMGEIDAASALLEGERGNAVRLNRRSTLARVQLLSQTGRIDDALSLVEQVLSSGFGDREFEEVYAQLNAGQAVPFDVIASPAEGMAQVFFDLSSVLNDDTADVALIYARLATFLSPDMAEGLLLVGELLSAQDQNVLASEAFDAVVASAPQFVEAEIGRADALEATGRDEEAIAVLSDLTRSHPDMLRPHYLLGRALREADRQEDAIDALTDAIDVIGEPEQRHWLVWYQRAIAHDQIDNWPAAERDFRFALTLDGENALLLNYLGYSLVERDGDLDEALDMIQRAVAERPYDGYITDSLAWVLYRLGRFEEAVEPMERALELAPVDPILNDHLGDIYWSVGRYREAEFQWHRALSFDPEEETAALIRRKLEIGLDAVLAEEALDEATDQSEAMLSE